MSEDRIRELETEILTLRLRVEDLQGANNMEVMRRREVESRLDSSLQLTAALVAGFRSFIACSGKEWLLDQLTVRDMRIVAEAWCVYRVYQRQDKEPPESMIEALRRLGTALKDGGYPVEERQDGP